MTIPRILTSMLAVVLAVAISAGAADKKKDKPKAKTIKLKDIKLTIPGDWKQEQPKSRLRVGQFKVPAVKGDKEGAELAIFFFGGDGGGADANIRRWIGQFQTKGRKSRVTQGKSPQGQYVVLDITGTYNKPIGPPVLRNTRPTPGSRMLAVILAVEKKGNYFLKLTGPAKTVASAATAFRQSFGGNAKAEKAYGEDSKKKGD